MREKSSKIEELAYKKLKHQLKQRLGLLKQNPNEILQRHQQIDKDSTGRPYANAVQIKIVFCHHIH